MNKVLVLTNSINGLYSFRKELIEKLIEEGYEVSISFPAGTANTYFSDLGCNLIETFINRRGTNPIKDFKLLLIYRKIINKIRPNVVLTYTIKPNVYGGMACRFLRVPYLANITGLGSSIENKGLIKIISLSLYKIALKSALCIFFQNEDNMDFFLSNRTVSINKVKRIPGSGVNLKHHIFEEYPNEDGQVRFLFIGRIMRDKGVDEIFEAAEKVKKDYPNTEFVFIGRKEENYDDRLIELENEGIIHYCGPQEKEGVHRFIKESHAIINPSYHEGMSNVLLESASSGRPVLATNIPGCKETFDEGVSGFGFEVKNVESLVKTIIRFIELPYDEKKKMGLAGRKKMENEFDRNSVVQTYLQEIKSAMEGKIL